MTVIFPGKPILQENNNEGSKWIVKKVGILVIDAIRNLPGLLLVTGIYKDGNYVLILFAVLLVITMNCCNIALIHMIILEEFEKTGIIPGKTFELKNFLQNIRPNINKVMLYFMLHCKEGLGIALFHVTIFVLFFFIARFFKLEFSLYFWISFLLWTIVNVGMLFTARQMVLFDHIGIGFMQIPVKTLYEPYIFTNAIHDLFLGFFTLGLFDEFSDTFSRIIILWIIIIMHFVNVYVIIENIRKDTLTKNTK